MMDIKFLETKSKKITSQDLAKIKVDVIVIPCFEDQKQNDYLYSCGTNFKNELQRLQKNKTFTAKKCTTATISTLNQTTASNIILVGLGKQVDLDPEILRRAVNKAHKKVKCLKADSYLNLLNEITLPNNQKNLKNIDMTQLVTEVAFLSNYEFNLYKAKDKEDNYHGPKTMFISSLQNNKNLFQNSINKAKIISEATCYARDLINTSPSELYPQTLADEAKKLESDNTKVTVFDEKQLKKMGCNGILAVGQGSQRQPRLIVIDYNPKSVNNQTKPKSTQTVKQKTNQKTNQKTIAIVGKGITFDSGGLNIKPGKYMETMKCDMSGAANAIAIVKAAQKLKIQKRIYAVCAAAENMPSGRSYRPDDVIKMYSGKTAEIGNTDAEGRIVLGDALAYTEKNLKPDQIIDFATLTGACVVALGNFTSGLMTTNEDMAKNIIKASNTTGDFVWRLPLWEDYKDLMKSSIADVRNISSGRAAGTITAAIFLQHFVEKTPWAHIDIAGTAFLEKAHHYNPVGGTGAGVRLILEYLNQN
jgi:leucyl aminopeptidase